MATNWVCPIDGCLPGDNGTDQSKANNVLPTGSDAVAAGSTVIGSTSATGLNVTSGAAFAVNQFIQIPSRKEILKITAISVNALTVARGQNGTQPSATITLADVVLTGLDVNGFPPHCPICGAAAVAVSPAAVTAATGVAAGSQHPNDIDATYVVGVDDGNNTQYSTVAAYTLSNGQKVTPHTFPVTGGKVLRGAQVADPEANPSVTTNAVTPETINTVVGP